MASTGMHDQQTKGAARLGIRRVLRTRKIRRENAELLAVLAVIVSLAVAGILMQGGRAMIQEERVLDCPVAADGSVAHTHNEDCYDAEGRLVCPLPEVELHVHDDSCYTEDRTLACGLQEGEGAHTHSDACYDADGNLACGLEESAGHVHGDDCYEVNRTLTCGKDEITEEHVHGPGCFRTVVVDDGASADEGVEAGTDAETDPQLEIEGSDEVTDPEGTAEAVLSQEAQTFQHQFVNDKNEVQIKVNVEAPEGSLPEGTTMKVEWIDPKTVDQELVQQAIDAQAAAKKDVEPGKLLDLQAVDITFLDAEGNEVEPAKPVTVTLTSALANTSEQAVVVHVESEREARERAEAAGERTYEVEAQALDQLTDRELDKREMALANDQLAFDASQFSTYIIATTSLRHEMKSSDGKTVTVTVVAPAEAGIPQDAVIRVQEIGAGTDQYQDYAARANEAIGVDEASVALARFFDIKIEDAQGQEIQPQAPVNVKIELADAAQIEGDNPEANVVHFAQDAEGKAEETPEVLGATEKAGTTTFEAAGFSVYGVVYTVDFHWNVNGQEYDLSINGGDTISLKEVLAALHVVEEAEIDSFVEGIKIVEFSDPSLIVVTKLDETTTAGALKETLGVSPEYSAQLTEEQRAEMDAKELVAPDWALVTLKAFDTEESLTLTMSNGEVFIIEVTDARDPYGLDGRTFAIVTQRSGNNGEGNWYALQASVSTTMSTRGYYMDALRVNRTTSDGSEYVDASASAWKFEYYYNKDEETGVETSGYYISAGGKYLYIDPTKATKDDTNAANGSTATANPHSLNLVDSKQDGTLLQITQNNDGTYCIANELGLKLWNYGNNSYWLANDASDQGNSYVHLCLPEDTGDDASHKASLISADDTQPGQKIVVYQRVLQSDDTFKYFAIDGNGNMVEVSQSSDAIYWKGNLSIEWTLAELGSGYYTLYNEATGKYLVPKGDGYVVHSADDAAFGGDAKHLSISLPGREAGSYTSQIASWDYNKNLTYGMEVSGTATSPTIAPKELLSSQYFYFAARDPIVSDQLTTVDTVDSVSKGITIKMYDWGDSTGTDSAHNSNGWDGYSQSNGHNPAIQTRLQLLQDVLNGGNANDSNEYSTRVLKQGLAANTLDSTTGFPDITKKDGNNTTHNLSEIFSDQYLKSGNANHLFLQSVYDETGFFKYSSFENYAYLGNGNDFTVYEQIGTPSTRGTMSSSSGENLTAKDDSSLAEYQKVFLRGNFMPYNNLDVTKHTQNRYDPDLTLLADGDPRKNERLYLIENADSSWSPNPEASANYYFGMTVDAKFAQNPGGYADNGDPMLFEFNGDDDMWVYIDGVLVLDVGGVHDAFRGRINFRTGDVDVYTAGHGTIKDMAGNTISGHTTIKQMFKEANRFPDGTPWDETKVDDYFTGNTFKDYSTHDFKMIYMERGASASNLEMMFNLPVLTGSQFQVKKEMPETATGQAIQSAYADAAFYYTAYVKDGNSYVPCTRSYLTDHKLESPTYDDGTAVVWKSESNDETIFEVKPGQTAIFPAIDDSLEWYVVEVEPEAQSNMLESFAVTNSDPDTTVNGDPEHAHTYSDTYTRYLKSNVKTIKSRNIVTYQNRPADALVNELQIRKQLNGSMYEDPSTASGYIEATESSSPYFEYKVFIETTEGKLLPYSLGEYYRYDKDGKRVFYQDGNRVTATETNIGTGYAYVYENGTVEETTVQKITEHTSQNGSIADIRDGDLIVIKGLLEGTDFIVYERVDRSTMSKDGERGDNDKLYIYEGAEVEGAYIRATGENAPEHLTGTLFDEPDETGVVYAYDYERTHSGTGTIVQNKDALVTIKNRGDNPFSFIVEKRWENIDASDDSLAEASVTVTLGRYTLEDRAGTLVIGKTGVPDDAALAATYTVKDSEGRTVETYPFIDGGTIATVSLAPGAYTVTETITSDDPAYTSSHPMKDTEQTVTVVDGGTATVTFTSEYAVITGSLKITSTVTDGGSGADFSDVTYTVYDSNGDLVGDSPYAYSAVSGNGLTISDLKVGSYTVVESAVPSVSGYDVARTPTADAGATSTVAVAVADRGTGVASSATVYTEIPASGSTYKIGKPENWGSPIIIMEGDIEFPVGASVTLTFRTKDGWNRLNDFGENAVTYGDTKLQYHYGQIDNGNNAEYSITFTVAENTLLLVQVNMNQSDQIYDVSFTENISRGASVQSVSSPVSSRRTSATRVQKTSSGLLKAGAAASTTVTASNTGSDPISPDASKKYVADSLFSHEVTLTRSDLDSTTSTWWKLIDDLPGEDSHGNKYYYYISTVTETGMPEGTTATIQLGGAQGTEKVLVNSDNADEQHLVVTNSVGKPADVNLIKVDVNNTTAKLAGATFYLLCGEDLMSGDTAPMVTSLGEGTPTVIVNAEGVFEVPQAGVKIADLAPGTYTLVEKTPPAGYVITTGSWTFTVTPAGLLEGDSSIISGLTITIPNTPGQALPNAGGSGTLFATLVGAAMVAAGALYLTVSRRRAWAEARVAGSRQNGRA